MDVFEGFSKSSRYMERYGDVPFGLTLITGCSNFLNPPGFDQYKRKLLRRMRRRDTLARITKRIELYDRFFGRFGQECPLPKHLKRTVNSGFPRYNLMVDAHFMAEMCSGILVAVTDYSCFEGSLTLDAAADGEISAGMGNREMRTREGEIVLRDERDIVCVLCQGADEKTRVTGETQDVLFYAYGIPGVGVDSIYEGLTVAAETVKEFGLGTVVGIHVY